MAPASKTELANVKRLAIQILEEKGISPDEWLREKYAQVINENAGLLIKALKGNEKLGGD